MQTYGGSKSLSTNAIEKYFKQALLWKEIYNEFGNVEADIVQDYGAVEKILDLENLKELEIIIRPPNSDDVGIDLAHIIEERLREQNAEEYREKTQNKRQEETRA